MNSVLLIGSMTRDPELRYTPSGTAVATFTIAGQTTFEGRNSPFYLRCEIMGKRAETLPDDAPAGTGIMVAGKIDYQSWEKDDKKSSKVQVRVDRLEVMDQSLVVNTTDNAGGFRMEGGQNIATFVGTLGRDVVVRTIPSGDAVADFGIAVNESWKDKAGNWQEKTHWLNGAGWRGIANILGEGKKGMLIAVSGQLENNSFTDKDGNKRSETKLTARSAHLVRSPNGARAEQPAKVATQTVAANHEFPPTNDLPF